MGHPDWNLLARLGKLPEYKKQELIATDEENKALVLRIHELEEENRNLIAKVKLLETKKANKLTKKNG